jgi:hypothetical protein
MVAFCESSAESAGCLCERLNFIPKTTANNNADAYKIAATKELVHTAVSVEAERRLTGVAVCSASRRSCEQAY